MNPEKEYFFKNAVRAPAKKGDIIIFDANIWHAAGINKTQKPVEIITPLYTKPFIKQAMNYPRAFGLDFKHQGYQQSYSKRWAIMLLSQKLFKSFTNLKKVDSIKEIKKT